MDMDVERSPSEPSSQMHDVIRERTPPKVNQKIDRETFKRIWYYATQARDRITQRIEELDQEWDIERLLEMNAAALTLTAAFLLGHSLNPSLWLCARASLDENFRGW